MSPNNCFKIVSKVDTDASPIQDHVIQWKAFDLGPYTPAQVGKILFLVAKSCASTVPDNDKYLDEVRDVFLNALASNCPTKILTRKETNHFVSK